jgi:hypothetical protein
MYHACRPVTNPASPDDTKHSCLMSIISSLKLAILQMRASDVGEEMLNRNRKRVILSVHKVSY